MSFTDLQGPNGTVVKYRGVRNGSELAGISEFTGSNSLHGAGRWTLRRR